MKKIFLLLFAVCFAATLGFSQELRFSGYMNYGLGLEISDADDADPTIRVAGVDSEQIGGRFRFNAAYANADRTVGADFRFQLQGTTSNPSTVSALEDPNDHTHSLSNVANIGNSTYNLGLAYAYGWVRPLEILQIKAGIVADSTFETSGAFLRDDAGGGAGAGIFIRLTPIDNLNIGVGIYSRNASGSGSNNRIEDVGRIMDWDDAKYTFGLAYTMPEMFKINTSFRTFNAAGGGRESARFVGEIQLLAVENLTAIVETELDNLYAPDDDDIFKDKGLINFYQTLAYRMDDLRFGLNTAQYISNETGKDDIGLRFNPWVSYTMADGVIVPRLDAVYFLGGSRAEGVYDRRNDLTANHNHDAYAVSVRPSVRFNIDSRTSLEIGNAFYYGQPVTGDARIDNVVYMDLVVRF
jgi:hypothetical protein